MQKIVLIVALFVHLAACAQKSAGAITLNEVTRIETVLLPTACRAAKPVRRAAIVLPLLLPPSLRKPPAATGGKLLPATVSHASTQAGAH
jgi:hypothetical protein